MVSTNHLIVVSVLEGRNFPCYQDASLVIDGVIDKQVLSTDPISLTRSFFQIQMELAWEINQKALQQHRLHRTSVKLLMYTVDNATSTRTASGYIMLDLRTAKTPTEVIPQWYRVLNFTGHGPCPELHIQLSLEGNSQCSNSFPNDAGPALVLDPSCEYYSTGSSSAQRQLFIVTITLDCPSGLNESLNDYYYLYNLFNIEISSELFCTSDFKTESASVQILCDREELNMLFSCQKVMIISVCRRGEVLGEGSMKLNSLISSKSLKSNCNIKLSSGVMSFVDVTVQVDKDNSHLNSKDGDNEEMMPIKRSLTRTFEEVSTLPDQSRSNDVDNEFPATTAVIHSVEGSGSEYAHKIDSIPSPPKANLHLSVEDASQPLPQAPSSPVPGNPLPSILQPTPALNPPAIVLNAPSSPVSLTTVISQSESTIPEVLSSEVDQVASVAQLTASQTEEDILKKNLVLSAPTPTSDNPPIADVNSLIKQVKSQMTLLPVHASTQTDSPLSLGQSDRAGNAHNIHRYVLSIEIHSIENMNLKEGVRCFTKYVYPFIGCERPVISKPKISVVSREEIPLLGSPVSFTFMCSEVSLKDQLQCTPLSLEVWVPSEGVDNLAGTAKVPLSEVFKSTSTIVDHCVYYKCSMKVPVLPCNLLSQQSCALINCSLSLMDQGPSSADAAKHEYELPNVSEYLAAKELEIWKMSQEEAFTENIRERESSYLRILQEEWKKREEERQRLLTQKVKQYSSLENQLRHTLDRTQQERERLFEKEIKLQQLHDNLLIKEKTLQKDCERRVSNCQQLYEGKLNAQRERTEEFLRAVDMLKSQVSDLSKKVAAKDAELEGYRQQILSKPESKLQAELTLVHMEKSELEKKLSSAIRAKQHYKEQWSHALKELAAYRHKEQVFAQTVLQREQQELKSFAGTQKNAKEQRLLFDHLTEVKDEVKRLQKNMLHEKSGKEEMKSITRDCETEMAVNPDVARLIEERDILLQTGVYTHQDFTIQNLDERIKAALSR